MAETKYKIPDVEISTQLETEVLEHVKSASRDGGISTDRLARYSHITDRKAQDIVDKLVQAGKIEKV